MINYIDEHELKMQNGEVLDFADILVRAGRVENLRKAKWFIANGLELYNGSSPLGSNCYLAKYDGKLFFVEIVD